MTSVAESMTRGARWFAPTDKVVAAAQAMEELNVGAVPVCDGERLVGMLTDRDIVVRGVAQECDFKTLRVMDVMSMDVRWAREDDEIEDVLDEMARAQIRRMPVVDRDKRLVGIVSLGDVAAKDQDDALGVAGSLAEISSPAEPQR